MSNSAQPVVNTFPLGGVLFVVFLTLKLCGVIDWSWWWVTAPLWAPLAIFLAILLVGALFVGIGALAIKLFDK